MARERLMCGAAATEDEAFAACVRRAFRFEPDSLLGIVVRDVWDAGVRWASVRAVLEEDATLARVQETVALLNAMVVGREEHSETSRELVRRALAARPPDAALPVGEE